MRYCVEGDINVKFLALEQLELADSEGITQAIKKAVESEGGMIEQEWTSKLVGFGSDGTSVMVGKKVGVIANLKKLQPSLQGMHCCANRAD